MASLTCLGVGAGCGLSHAPSGGLSVLFFSMEADPKQQKEGQSQRASSFQVSVCITLANVSVAKASQIARPKSMWKGLT